MYKVALVDDERFTLKTFAKAINWELFGFEPIGLFSNGFDCLDYMKENPVDVVITDISMPQMDGITLSKMINEAWPDVKIVLVSAHKSFDYAREAVRLNIFDYIVKPYDRKTIEGVLEKLREELLKKNAAADIFSGSEEVIRMQKLIVDFLEHKNRSFAKQPVIIDEIDIRRVPVIIMNISIAEFEDYLNNIWRYGISGIYNAINNVIANERVLGFPLKYSFDNISFILFARDRNFGKLLALFDGLKNRIISECFELLNLSVNIDILQSGVSLLDVVDPEVQKLTEVYKQMLVSYIREHNIGGISANFAKVSDLFDGDTVKAYCVEVMNELINLFGSDAIQRKDEKYSDIFYINDADAVRERIERLCIEMAEETKYDDSYDAIKASQNYVKEHIEDGISIAEVAEYVSISPAYFGRIFREKTGEKFLDYVNRMKIEAAQHYLATTGMKVGEIYEKVGYKSRNYFYNMFKSIAGCSPQEYRDSRHKE